jgi:hypothetical protein
MVWLIFLENLDIFGPKWGSEYLLRAQKDTHQTPPFLEWHKDFRALKCPSLFISFFLSLLSSFFSFGCSWKSFILLLPSPGRGCCIQHLPQRGSTRLHCFWGADTPAGHPMDTPLSPGPWPLCQLVPRSSHGFEGLRWRLHRIRQPSPTGALVNS